MWQHFGNKRSDSLYYSDNGNNTNTPCDNSYTKLFKLALWEATEDIQGYIFKEQKEFQGEFCRGCGYCLPCPKGIQINSCARMSLMVRRAPSEAWLNEYWQEEMKKIETCIKCRQCTTRCPYKLNTPELLEKNYEDYKNILAGKVSVK